MLCAYIPAAAAAGPAAATGLTFSQQMHDDMSHRAERRLNTNQNLHWCSWFFIFILDISSRNQAPRLRFIHCTVTARLFLLQVVA